MTEKQEEYKTLLKNYKAKREWCRIATIEYKSSGNIDGLPKGKGYKPNYKLEELMDSIAELDNKLDNILLIINQLSPIHQDIISQHYIVGKTRKELAYENDVEIDRINHLIGYALNEFVEKVEKN